MKYKNNKSMKVGSAPREWSDLHGKQLVLTIILFAV